jgi:carboxyl-terminal processing protease
MDKSTGYIKITNFSKNTHTQFIDAVFTMKKTGLKTIVIDLRNNSGGYLVSATDIVDEFLENGKMIVYTEGRARGKKVTSATTKRSSCVGLDVIVLIDEFSASAAEIVAGAIQDNDRGFIIGRRSYGKGLVQESTTFDDGSVIRLTTARYYTPSGRCIQKSYENGLDEYYADIYNRYMHGEFLDQDSIKLNDSLSIKHQKAGWYMVVVELCRIFLFQSIPLDILLFIVRLVRKISITHFQSSMLIKIGRFSKNINQQRSCWHICSAISG